ncbi:flagellar export chaperone FlgN [Magnetospira sp. QH-2]|uniref:flagellar export chaperone FlgN n=1 Tax=Magnetospira sp. (strain QH-2) TaxID=1288970 RepID=UPI0003E81C19|nr:flagellar export chaperone FlgN [Magnetospira sp. QH-2]CCQ74134.1 Export chaperone involved in flagellar synthesis, FlgN [Magnetospira sp. QH-2]
MNSPDTSKYPHADLVDDIFYVAERMIDFLERENQALYDKNYDLIKETVDEKIKLSIGYEKLYRKLSSNPEALAQLPDEVRQELREMAKDLDDLLDENGMLLEAKIKAVQIVVNMVAEAARTTKNGPSTYDADGAVAREEPRAPTRTSFALDRNF